jgi:hypothetical protein
MSEIMKNKVIEGEYALYGIKGGSIKLSVKYNKMNDNRLSYFNLVIL